MSTQRFIFMTAAFGVAYREAVNGLIRSFSMHHDPNSLVVFTDQQISHCRVVRTRLHDLLCGLPDYYYLGARRNVFKFELFRRLLSASPGTTVVWIDADTSVHAPLEPHLHHGRVNVARLTRTPGPIYDYGDGLRVQTDRCASGNFYALPSTEALEDLDRLVHDRLTWPDADAVQSGDQALLNHLIHRSHHEVGWIEHPGRGIFSTGFAWDIRHRANHDGCLEEPATGRLLYRGEPIVLLSTTKEWLDQGLQSGFREFPPALRARLRHVYSWRDRSVRARAASVAVWYLAVRVPANVRSLLRGIPGLRFAWRAVTGRFGGSRRAAVDRNRPAGRT